MFLVERRSEERFVRARVRRRDVPTIARNKNVRGQGERLVMVRVSYG